MLAIFLAALANVIGLGVIVPLLPYFALHHGASAGEAAWLFSVFHECGSRYLPVLIECGSFGSRYLHVAN